MIGRSKHLKMFVLVLAALVFGPGMASATSFSFGDIDASDGIQSIIVVSTSTGVSYTAATATTGTLVIDGYVSTINFVNKPSISINPGDVTYSSQLDLTVDSFIGPSFSVAALSAQLTNGMTDDFSLIDNVGALPLLGGNYVGPMSLFASPNTGLVLANFNADIGAGLSGDADVLSAFGSAGTIEFQAVLGTGSLCTSILTCPAVTNPLGTPALDSFSGPINGSIAPIIPEPSTALLLGVGLAGLTLRRRRHRGHARPS